MLVRLLREILDVAVEPAARRGTRRSTRRPRPSSARSRPARGTGGPAARPSARRSRPIASSTRPIFSIALTAPPSSGWSLRDARVAGAALDGDRRQEAAAARDPDVEPARLGHDRRVGPQRPRHREPAGAGRLLLGHRVDDQVARAAGSPSRASVSAASDHAGDAALHVARAAAVDAAVVDHRGARRMRPALDGARPTRRRCGR